ncbi:MAG TPA: RNase adapter RapZ, partial [Myxococcaceae bacterium]|nr:RNase adapter RapZ [Myxococcaceae bacterium]
PPQADLVFDVRFLPNPYFVPDLKGLTGKDPRVSAYVLDREETQQFVEKVVDLCRFLFPRYQKEGKAYLTVALGCTGGKHRSVAIAEELRQRLVGDHPRVQLWDRDIEKE